MRKILLLMIALCCLEQTMYGQRKMRTQKDIKEYFNRVVDSTNVKSIGTITTTTSDDITTPAVPMASKSKNGRKTQGVLFSTPTLNNIFAKNIAYYLSGDNDISTFSNYFTASSKDKTVSVGYNFVNTKEEDNNDTVRLRTIISLGVKGGLGTFLQEKKVPSDIGVSFSHTNLFRGTVTFNGSFKDTLAVRRTYLKAALQRELEKSLAEFDALNADLGSNPIADLTIKTKRKKLENSLYKTLRTTFAEQEEAAAKYSFIENSWFTYNLYISLNTTKYNISSSNGKKIDTLNFYPAYGGITFGYYKKWQNTKKLCCPNILATLSANIILDNSLRILDT